MASIQIRSLLAALAVTSLAGSVQPAWASLPISQQPLVVPGHIKPAFIMALDNSGSIGSDETLCVTNQGGCAFKLSGGTVAHPNGFFEGDGSMYVEGSGGTHTYLRAIRGNNGAKKGTDVDASGSEGPRVDKFAPLRDPEYNRAYFNPSNSYLPWLNFDATPYLGNCPAGVCGTTSSSGVAITSAIANYIDQITGNAVVTAAPEDPRHPAKATVNSNAGVTIDFTTPVWVSYTYAVGDVIPAGNSIVYESSTATTNGANSVLDCDNLKTKLTSAPYPGAPANGTPIVLQSDYTVPGSSCNRKITTLYLPATVYLSTNTAVAPDAILGFNLTKVITVKGVGPLGVDLYKYEILPGNFINTTTASAAQNYAAAIQGFANYWTLYGDRARSIVAATTVAFTGVDFMRAGSFDINTGGAQFGWGDLVGYGAGHDPLVTMYDLGDYVYDSTVASNPTPPVGGICTSDVHGVTAPAGCVKISGGGDRAKIYNQFFAFDNPNNSTPTRRSVYRIGHQFQRGPLTSGVSDTYPPILLKCQINGGMLFTDGYINDTSGSPPAVANQADAGLGSPYADTQPGPTMADVGAYFYNTNLRPDLPVGKVATPSACQVVGHSPQLDCNTNLHMNFFGIPLGARGKFYDVPPYVDLLGTPNIDEATNAAYASQPAWAATGTTNLQPSDVDDIWHTSINSHGKFISAQSPASVRDGIRTVINAISDANITTGALSVIGARIGAGSITYTPSFATGDAGHDWTGDVEADSINADGSIGAKLWNAQSKLQSLSAIQRQNRKIFIDTKTGPLPAVDFTSGNPGALGATEALQLGFLGISQVVFHLNYDSAANGVATVPRAIDYLKGLIANEVSSGGTFRNRSRILGDIINAIPETSDKTDDFGFGDSLLSVSDSNENAMALSYPAFLTAKATRTPATVVYQGANDGMLHAFDGTAGGGNELFAVIPNSVASKLSALLDPIYPHDFFVDGGDTVFDACIGPLGSCTWKTVLVGSTGAGGSGAFALDVTSPSTFSAAKVMWEQTNSDVDIGSDVGTPLVILGEDDQWYAAFGNGYNSTNSKPVLILVNMTTGAITKKLTGNSGLVGVDNGIGEIAALDTDGDGKVDTIYGGDYQGDMWKFDLSTNTPSTWTVAFGNKPLYVAKDASGNRQPITGGIETSTGPLGGQLVYFGTGSYFLTTDNASVPSPPVQSLYAVWDNGSADTTSRASGNDLVQQTISAANSTAGAITRQTSSNPVSYSAGSTTQRGFFMDLINPGQPFSSPPIPAGPNAEKFIGTARVQNGIVFYTTFEPSGDSCQPGGLNWEYGLNALSGANALSELHLDTLSGTAVCPSGGCGALQLAQPSGSGPVKKVSIVIPPPGCLAGTTGCTQQPAKDDCSSGVCVPAIAYPYTACTIVVRVAGAKPQVLPRPCGRQSWRQVR